MSLIRSVKSFFRRSRFKLPRLKLPRFKLPKLPLPGKNVVSGGVSSIGKRLTVFQPPKWARGGLGPVSGRPPKLVDYFNPIFWIFWSALLFWRWILSRPYISLGAAFPAILVGGGLALLFINQSRQPANWKTNIYRNHLQQAVQASDVDSARVSLLVLTSLNPKSEDFRFQRVLVESEMGEQELARQHAARLVSTEQSGRAALWLANDILRTADPRSLSEQQQAEIRMLLDLAVRRLDGPQLTEARALLARYVSMFGAYSDAQRVLGDIASSDKRFALEAALRSYQSGDILRGRRLAADAVEFFRAQMVEQPFDFDIRVSLVRAMQLAGDFDELDGIKVFQDGFQATGDERFRTGQVELAVLRAERIAKETDSQSEEKLLERFKALDIALTIAPDNPRVLGAVSKLLIDNRDIRSDQLESLRLKILGQAGEQIVSFVAATRALQDGDNAEAVRIFNRLAQQNSGLPSVLNNMAVAIANSPGGDLTQALALSEQALSRLPEHPYLRDTRGQILLRLGRPAEALPDLEAALAATELHGEVFPALAEAHRALGNNDLADVYQQRAEEAKALKEQ